MSDTPDSRPALVSDEELHAFVDAQIAAERLPAVLAWLQAHPEAAARVLQWQTQRVQLRELARGIEPGETPPALINTVLQAGRAARWRLGWQQAAAVLLLVAAGVTAGRFWEQQVSLDNTAARSDSPMFVRDALAAHAVFVPEKRHPVEVAAADEAHLVQWLSRRLGAPLKIPSLAAQGYQLLGGRLLPGEGTPRAQFMFENAQGVRVTLYITIFTAADAPPPASFRSARIGAEESFYWIEDRHGYALSASISSAEMQALAREVYAQLTR